MSLSPEVRRRLIPEVGRLLRVIRRGGRALSFWTAVLLPIAYLGLFVLRPEGHGSQELLFGVLVVHLLALLGGREYGPTSRSGGGPFQRE